MDKSRLEIFSDGVFAIIITLIVIEIRIPELDLMHTNNQELIRKIIEMSPLFASYFLSVAVVSMFWTGHHFLFNMYAKSADRVLTQLNFVYLAFLSIIPFSSSLLGRYPNLSSAVMFYGVNIILIFVVNRIMVDYSINSDTIENGPIMSRTRTQGRIRLYISLACTILGIIVATWNTGIAIFLYLIPVVFNNIPGLLNYSEKLFGFEIK
jgi:uncharacterized membrane protein